jgi:hypothetical protein
MHALMSANDPKQSRRNAAIRLTLSTTVQFDLRLTRSQFGADPPQPKAVWDPQFWAATAVTVPGALTSTECISTRDDKEAYSNDVRWF